MISTLMIRYINDKNSNKYGPKVLSVSYITQIKEVTEITKQKSFYT